MGSYDWVDHEYLVGLKSQGLVTSTFLRLEAARREKLLDALFAESAKSGPERINIKAVAESSGLPVGSLYQYFGDRERLARFAALLVSRKLSGELETVFPYLEALPLRDALTQYLKGGIEWSFQAAASLRSFVVAAYGSSLKGSLFDPQKAGSPDEGAADGDDWFVASLIRPVAEALYCLIRRLFEAAEARGELREGLDLEMAAKLANALMIAVGDARMMPGLDRYYRLYEGCAEPDSRVDAAIDFICRSILRSAG
jgi:AcrR family transcriptional regulator